MRRILGTALALGVMTLTSSSAVFADVMADTLPKLNNAQNGTVDYQDGNKLNVQVNKGNNQVGKFYWDSFNVGKDATVNFEFTGHNQTAFNKVEQAGGLSQIYGKLTQSGCEGCGYEGSGKVILINPNGVLFGDGANVNLNSFTVSTFDGEFDEHSNTLNLHRDGKTTEHGITVDNNATITGNKNIALVSDKVHLLKGSKLKTDGQLGKIKIVTSDGVHFTYANTGVIQSLTDIKPTDQEMTVSVEGELNSGHIDIRNMSTNENSQISLNGAKLKATKAVMGNDGKIWLTSANKVLIEDSELTTDNYSADDAGRDGGEVKILAGKKVSITDSKINSVDKINIESQKDDVVSHQSVLTAANDINIKASKVAAVQQPKKEYGFGGVDIKDVENSKVESKNGNITIEGGERAQVLDSYVVGKSVNIKSPNLAWTRNSIINSNDGDINVTSEKDLLMDSTSVVAVGDINIKTANDINTKNFVNNDLVINTSNTRKNGNINLESTNGNISLKNLEGFSVYLAEDESTINLKAGKDVSLNTDDSDLEDMDQKINIEAGKNINLTSSSDKAFTVGDNFVFKKAEKINIEGKGDVTVNGDMNNIQTNLTAGKNLNATLKGVGTRENGLVAEAKENMNLTVTEGDLSVSRLVSGNDMSLKVEEGKILSGSPKTSETLKQPNDSDDRAYIEVGGTFTTDENNSYVVTESAGLTEDGKYMKRHHIEFGEEGNKEKILLVNKREVDNKVTDPNIKDSDFAGDVDPDTPDSGAIGGGDDGGDEEGTGSTTPSTDPSESTQPSETQPTDPSDPTDCISPDDGSDPHNPKPTPDEGNPELQSANSISAFGLAKTKSNISSYLFDVNSKKSR